jgi:hypothetical protein
MTIDLRRCSMIPAFALRGVRNKMPLHGLLD